MIHSSALLMCAGAAFLLLGIACVRCVRSMLKANRTDILAAAPVMPEQEIVVPSAGAAILIVESPRLAADYRRMQVELVEQQSGQSVTMGYSAVTSGATVYGVTTMQVPFGRANLRAGRYLARVHGLEPGQDYSRYRLIVSRPYIGRLTLQIIVLVLCGVGMLLSLIWAAWLAGWMTTASLRPVAELQPCPRSRAS